MNIDNIEKCQALLDQRKKYREIAKTLEGEDCQVLIRVPFNKDGILLDEDLMNDVQDAIALRLEGIDKRLAQL